MKLADYNDPPETPSNPPEQDAAEGFVRGADGRRYPQGSDPRTRRSLKRKWKWAVAITAVLLAVAMIPLGGWYMLGQEPAHYSAYRKQMKQADPREIQRIAEGLEAAVLGDLLATEVTDDLTGEQSGVTTSNVTLDPTATAADAHRTQLIKGMKVTDLGRDKQGRALREIELGPAQVNAWLVASFNDWLDYRDFDMPSEIRSPMMDVANGKTTLFFTFESESFSQMFQADFNLKLEEDGMATLHLNRMQAGRVPVPVDSLGSVVSKAAGQVGTAQRASEWVGKIQNYRFKPTMKLPDGLKAQVLGYKTAGDKVILKLAIERYRPSSKTKKVTNIAAVSPAPAVAE